MIDKVLYSIVEFILRCFLVLFWYLEALFRKFVPPPMMPIDGETILITGAAGGIGKELCRYLIASGSNLKLVLWDLNMKELKLLADELCASETGAQIFPYEVDVSSRENIDAISNRVKNEVGPISIIFNNAGVAPTGNFLQLKNSEIEKTLQVNLISHFWIIRQFLPDMVSKNHGRIVAIASIGSFFAGPHGSPYFVSKFGVNGLMDALRVELQLLKCSGICCTTIFPYFVKTPLLKTLQLDNERRSWFVEDFLEPAEVARKAVDGMRREYELVYLPQSISFFKFLEYLTPAKYWKNLKSCYCNSFMYKDTAEQNRFQTTFRDTEAKTK